MNCPSIQWQLSPKLVVNEMQYVPINNAHASKYISSYRNTISMPFLSF